MIVAGAKDLKKEYGTDVILQGVTFSVNAGDRVGIVGPNGAGKTTLLRLLTGELPKDGGSVFISPDARVGYLHQSMDLTQDRTIREEVESIFEPIRQMEERLHEISDSIPKLEGEEQQRAIRDFDELMEKYEDRGGYMYKSEIRGILTSMAFSEERYDARITELSGGEKTRLALALLLMQKPDLLLLDEPTNHLDIGTLRWLEQYLNGYTKTLMVVSHDRYFLDRVCSRIFDISGGALTAYNGNYTEYAEKKRLRREEALRHYQTYEKEKERQEDIIRRMRQRGTEHLAKRARSREIKLAKMEEQEKPVLPEKERGRMHIAFKERFQSGNDVLHVENVSKHFGEGDARQDLFSGVSLDLKRGERVCMVGANGIGKTTLLKMILGVTPRDSGRIQTGHNVRMAYYDQEQQLLHPDRTVLDEVHDDYRTYTTTEIRTILGSFLFRGDDVFLPVSQLSGGEKARLALLKLMLSGGNLLLLDEPTNHLDIESREIFEDALMDFPGTCLIISHDRYFLNKVPTRIVELERDGLVNYLGKYDYYFHKKQEIQSGRKYLEQLGRDRGSAGTGSTSGAAGGNGAAGSAAAEGVAGGSAASENPAAEDAAADDPFAGLSPAEARQRKKELEARQRRAAREKQALEEKIQALEKNISELEEEMCRPDILEDHEKLLELDEQVRDRQKQLDEAYEEWLAREEE